MTPRSDEESIELARQIVADGVTKTAVTPHFNAWNIDLPKSIDELRPQFDYLRSLLSRANISLEIQSGAEHFLTPELVTQIESKHAPLLGEGPYILIELPFGDRPLYAGDVLKRIMALGIRPVLAHPERYNWVQHDPSAIMPLLEANVTLQCTAASILGHYGSRVQRTAEQLFHWGAYQLVGSDLHRPGQPRRLLDMERAVFDLSGEHTAWTLFHENPNRVLNGEPLLRPEPRPPEDTEDGDSEYSVRRRGSLKLRCPSLHPESSRLRPPSPIEEAQSARVRAV